MSIFGNTNTGPNIGGISVIRGGLFTCPNSGYTTSIVAYLYMENGGATGKAKACLYDVSNNRSAFSAEQNISEGSGWYTFNISTLVITGNQYYLTVWGTSTGYIYLWAQTTTGIDNFHFSQPEAYNSFPDPIVWGGGSPNPDKTASIYCNFNPTGLISPDIIKKAIIR